MGPGPGRASEQSSAGALILADTSAWIEYLRDTGTPPCEQLDEGLRTAALAVCDAVRLEILAGARDSRHQGELERLLARAVDLPIEPGHYDLAASLYRACRRQGETPRNLVDCLIAAVAIESGVAVLHADRDFDLIARHTPLQVA
mgnify:CR=1 FL=1